MLVDVKDHKHLVRDMDSNAIINTDKEALRAAKMNKAARNQTQKDVEVLKGQMANIEKMLTVIMEKLE